MARVSLVQTNFTAGEISPRLVGRTDIERYNNAARSLINAMPVIHGGAKRRPGTRYIAATKLAAKRSRLIPFVFSRDAAYMLEVGENYLRVYAAGGTYSGVELATTYTEAMLPDIDYAQGADTMFLAHPTVAIQRLRRFSGAAFDLSAAPFTTLPFDEQGHALAADLTLSAATVGAGRIATASAGVFLPSDVDRVLTFGAGIATVTGYNSATSLTVEITVAFTATAAAAGTWLMEGSPAGFIKCFAKEPAGSVTTLYGGSIRASNITLSAKTGAITITSSVGIFTAGDVGLKLYADSGVAQITVFTSPTSVNANVTQDFADVLYNAGGYAVDGGVFRAEDVGKFAVFNNGLFKITAFGNSSFVTGTLVKALNGTVAVPPLAWSLESSVWSPTNGYPRTLTLHEQRLVAGGNTRYPQTLWGSRTGEYLDFTKGPDDTDSYSFTIAADEVNPISYVATLRNLVVHTYGGEFSMQGGVEKPITPTNVRMRPESAHGSKGVRPVTVGKESIFVQRAGRKVRAFGYRYEQDGYVSPDLTQLAEHMTEAGIITQLAYQQEPDQVLWGVRDDGAMISCTLDRDQSVLGWAKHYTQGFIESIATIPNGEREETWVIVRRIINGNSVRYLEILDDSWEPMLPGTPVADALPPPALPAVYGYTADAGIVFDNAAGQSTFNIPHLASMPVHVVADGAVQPNATVDTSGNFTLARPSKRTLIGLPFRSEVGLLTPEVSSGAGTAQGSSMRTSELTLRFLNTIGAKVYDGEGNEQEVPFRRLGEDVLDAPPQLFTGNVRIETLGWARGRSELTVVQDQPLPMHLLSVVRKFTVNEG